MSAVHGIHTSHALWYKYSFVPRLSRVRMYCVTFDPHEEWRGEPGEFYHMSDVKGRENVLKVERTLLDVGRFMAALYLAHAYKHGVLQHTRPALGSNGSLRLHAMQFVVCHSHYNPVSVSPLYP